jgi:polysaccharide export outer membrane protein
MSAYSCTTAKKVPYLQDAGSFIRQKIPDSYQIRIGDDDLLSIVVSSKDTLLAMPFNRTPERQGYLVDAAGSISFPIFGAMKVAGMTPSELADSIRLTIVRKGYIKDAEVAVKILNFKVSVMGEVNRPGVYSIPTQRVTVLEALSLAGDMSVYGRRDRVLVVREENGVREMRYMDVNSTSLFNSPYYFLRQNDLVYVEPNRARSTQSESNQRLPLFLAGLSVVATLASLIIVIEK